MKSAVKLFVPYNKPSMVEEALDDVQSRMYHRAQSGVLSVVFNVVEQVILDLLPKDVIGKLLEAHIAKSYDTDECAEGLLKRLLTSNYFMSPLATFVRCRMDTAMEEKKFSAAVASKELGDNI